MGSPSPLRPIAVNRPMRATRPITLTLSRGLSSRERRDSLASRRVGGSPLALQVFARGHDFRLHLSALGGRHDATAPRLSMELRRRVRRGPVIAPQSARVVRWPWGFPPSLAIPAQHEAFLGQSVLSTLR